MQYIISPDRRLSVFHLRERDREALGLEKRQRQNVLELIFISSVSWKLQIFLGRGKFDTMNDMDFTWQAILFEMKPVLIK